MFTTVQAGQVRPGDELWDGHETGRDVLQVRVDGTVTHITFTDGTTVTHQSTSPTLVNEADPFDLMDDEELDAYWADQAADMLREERRLTMTP